MPKIITDEEIFRAVMQVVSECGYAGATTKQMAEAANVSEVTLFRKYDNKLQLIKQAVTAIITQTDFEAVTQFTGDVSADLLRVVQAYQDSAVKHGQFIFILLSELPRYPELGDLLNKPFNIFTNISQLLTNYQSEGILRQEHPMHALAALLGPLIYVSMMQKAIFEGSIPPLDLENHVACFLEGRRVERQVESSAKLLDRV
jgi:AcrR family transcriptional regulator